MTAPVEIVYVIGEFNQIKQQSHWKADRILRNFI